MRSARLRTSEWLLVGFFAYIVLLEPFFRDRARLQFQPVAVLLVVFAFLYALAGAGRFPLVSIARDWLPLALTLVAFQEMELFLPSHFSHTFESAWIVWDHAILGRFRLREIIESAGWLLPAILEFCYLLVYGTGAFCIGILYSERVRGQIDRFFTVYLIGTLMAYALFPFFPSEPPRLVFPAVDPPTVNTWLRTFNLFILRKGTIHIGVFPSAHVSSAFSAAWAMLLILGRKSLVAWCLLVYAILVSVATIYGRYHYSADVAAGFLISLVAGAACLLLRRRTAVLSSGR